jgi:hypothetical protein
MYDIDTLAPPVAESSPAGPIKVRQRGQQARGMEVSRELLALVSYLRQQEAVIRDRFGQLQQGR